MSSGKYLDDFSHAHIIFSMYKVISSPRGSDDLFIGFDRDHRWRQQELGTNKYQKRKYNVRLMLRDIFGYVLHQERAS